MGDACIKFLSLPSSDVCVRNFSEVKYPFCKFNAEFHNGATLSSRLASAALSFNNSTHVVMASVRNGTCKKLN